MLGESPEGFPAGRGEIWGQGQLRGRVGPTSWPQDHLPLVELVKPVSFEGISALWIPSKIKWSGGWGKERRKGGGRPESEEVEVSCKAGHVLDHPHQKVP